MALTIYRSTDAGAPSLTTTPGSFIALLDACLRTGYGAKAGAGWTKPYTGTNIAVFRQGTGGNGRYVRIVNNRTVEDPATYCYTANARGYEAMTAVSTGTGPFPTTSQQDANGMMVRIAVASPGYTPAWIVRANSNWFDVFISTGYGQSETGTPRYDGWFAFGSFPSLKSGDLYNDFIVGDGNKNYWPYYYVNSPAGQCYISRSDVGTIGAKEATFYPMFTQESSYMGTGVPSVFQYPNRVNNTIMMHQYGLLCDGYLRGTLPGTWSSAHGAQRLGFGNTVGGQGAMAGRSFEIINTGIQGDTGFLLETTDTFTGI